MSAKRRNIPLNKDKGFVINKETIQVTIPSEK